MKLKINFKIHDDSFNDFSTRIFSIEPIKINYNKENLEETINFLAKENMLKYNNNLLFFTFNQNEEDIYFELDIDLYEKEEAKLLEVDHFINDIILKLTGEIETTLENRGYIIDYIDTIINFTYSEATFYNKYQYREYTDDEYQEVILIDGFGRVKNELISYEKFLKRSKK